MSINSGEAVELTLKIPGDEDQPPFRNQSAWQSELPTGRQSELGLIDGSGLSI